MPSSSAERRVFVTGSGGMLGRAVVEALAAAGQTPLPDRSGDERLDVAEPDAVQRWLDGVRPDVVIHCAAYTRVDQAEREADAAYRTNALGSWRTACACAERGIPLCAISTDYVFDGVLGRPYTEYDTPNPLNVYGASKLAGETHIRQICPKHWIVRTAWLFGRHAACFPGNIIRAAMTRPELRVVADQTGSPTSASDLAAVLVDLINQPLYGTYHIVNAGQATWFELATAALELAGLGNVPILPITTGEWPAAAPRPAFSVLRPLALEMQGRARMRLWRDALADYVRELLETELRE